jgi:hypothetical protein
MSAPQDPLFLERSSYRGRRLVEAVRVLAVLGGVLVLLPIFLLPRDAPLMGLSGLVRYFFGVWVALIAATWALSRLLRRHSQHES